MKVWVSKAHSTYLDACCVGLGLTKEVAEKALLDSIFEYYVIHEIGDARDAAFKAWNDEHWVSCTYDQEL